MFEPRAAKKVPFAFVLDELEPLRPTTRPMFGCLAVYVGPKIVLVLRERATSPRDDGVWLATTREHHETLRLELPSLRGIHVLGGASSGWQLIPKGARDFEEEVLRACGLIRAKDPRVGKVPKPRRRTAPTAGAEVATRAPRLLAKKATRAKGARRPSVVRSPRSR